MLLDILEEHFDEASFLYERWKSLVETAPGSTEVYDVVNRLQAHLDGLLLGGDSAWSLCESKLGAGDRGDRFVAMFVALMDEGRRAALERAMRSGSDDMRATFQDALRAQRGKLDTSRGSPEVAHE